MACSLRPVADADTSPRWKLCATCEVDNRIVHATMLSKRYEEHRVRPRTKVSTILMGPYNRTPVCDLVSRGLFESVYRPSNVQSLLKSIEAGPYSLGQNRNLGSRLTLQDTYCKSEVARCVIRRTCTTGPAHTGAASASLETPVVVPVSSAGATRHASILKALALPTVATPVRSASISLPEGTTGSRSSMLAMLRGREWKSDCDKEDRK